MRKPPLSTAGESGMLTDGALHPREASLPGALPDPHRGHQTLPGKSLWGLQNVDLRRMKGQKGGDGRSRAQIIKMEH